MRYDELEQVLNAVENKTEPPLWVYIRDNYEKIVKARESGVTYKKMAAVLKVTPRSFSVALKKAKAERAKLQAESENKAVKAKVNKATSFTKNDDDSELPAALGVKKKQTNYLPGVKKI